MNTQRKATTIDNAANEVYAMYNKLELLQLTTLDATDVVPHIKGNIFRVLDKLRRQVAAAQLAIEDTRPMC